MFDLHANFGYSVVAVAPVPANSGTSLQVVAGQGALFPAAPFNCSVWPAGVNPLASNAEIVRVTAVVGDTLTIVRAQEGTGAINIAVGFQIANTTSRLVFTDIENAIAISAGTQNFQGPFTFADANGITFGMNNGTVTGSVATAAGGGVGISAGGNSQSTGVITFANSNGITFGLDGAGVMTASHDGITSQSNPAFSASGGSSTFQTLSFANSNGLTFSNSNGSLIASYTVPNTAGLISFVNFSAGATSNNLAAITFANGNGITFGLNAGTMTASHNGLTSQSNQAASASNGSFDFQTLGFTNANGVTFGTSAGSLIFASVAAAAAAGNGLQFVFMPTPWAGNNTTFIPFQHTQGFFDPFYLDSPISFNVIRSIHSYQGAGASSTASVTGLKAFSQSFAVYSRSVTDSAATNFSNSTNWVTVFSGFQTTTCGWSASSQSQSIAYGFQTDSTGGSSSISHSTVGAAAISMTLLNGSKMGNVYYNSSLPPGEYMAFFNFSTSSAGGANTINSNLLYVTNLYFSMASQSNFGISFNAPLATTNPVIPGLGAYSASLGIVPASVGQSEIQFGASRRYMIFSRS